jgi:hypothetical protein
VIETNQPFNANCVCARHAVHHEVQSAIRSCGSLANPRHFIPALRGGRSGSFAIGAPGHSGAVTTAAGPSASVAPFSVVYDLLSDIQRIYRSH